MKDQLTNVAAQYYASRAVDCGKTNASAREALAARDRYRRPAL
jgi:hypothetical protein